MVDTINASSVHFLLHAIINSVLVYNSKLTRRWPHSEYNANWNLPKETGCCKKVQALFINPENPLFINP